MCMRPSQRRGLRKYCRSRLACAEYTTWLAAELGSKFNAATGCSWRGNPEWLVTRQGPERRAGLPLPRIGVRPQHDPFVMMSSGVFKNCGFCATDGQLFLIGAAIASTAPSSTVNGRCGSIPSGLARTQVVGLRSAVQLISGIDAAVCASKSYELLTEISCGPVTAAAPKLAVGQ